ncbi:MAG: hypothetical protein O3C60_08410 [Planctomycetota bacterium]|nr:hypothetical protein [Planctomycetota bacterium]
MGAVRGMGAVLGMGARVNLANLSGTKLQHGAIALGILIALNSCSSHVVFAQSDDTTSARKKPSQETLRAYRIRVVEGDNLTLFTDHPPNEEINSLPVLFTQALPGWREYFGCAHVPIAAWHMRGYLMQDPERFRQAGLLPPDLPPFLHGYQRQDEFWLYDQPSDYYRRHLVLHEGTHGFAHRVGAEPLDPWLREGIAERLATHLWDQQELVLRWFPSHRDQVPHWGRIKIIQDEIAQQRYLSLREVVTLPEIAFRRNEGYAWSWAAVMFFELHPATAKVFLKWRESLTSSRGTLNTFAGRVSGMDAELEDDWYLFVRELRYGKEFTPLTISDHKLPPQDLADAGIALQVDARLGWQNTGVRLLANRSYQIQAEGRYVVATEPRPWWTEPGGVTIDYVGGRPLGQLLAAVAPVEPGRRGPSLADPAGVGSSGVVRPTKGGVLFLRVNDRAGDLRDNEGTLRVTVTNGPGRRP